MLYSSGVMFTIGRLYKLTNVLGHYVKILNMIVTMKIDLSDVNG